MHLLTNMKHNSITPPWIIVDERQVLWEELDWHILGLDSESRTLVEKQKTEAADLPKSNKNMEVGGALSETKGGSKNTLEKQTRSFIYFAGDQN